MDKDLQTLRTALMTARKEHDAATARQKALVERFHLLPEIIEANARALETQRHEAEVTASLRDAILEDYRLHGKKAPLPGLGVREIERPEIVDPDAVLEWCQTEAPCLLQVKEKAVLAYHKHVGPVPGIETVTEWQATISANLEA